MNVTEMQIRVSDSIGPVSAVLTEAADHKAVMVLAHGAGAGMHHPFMQRLSIELATFRISTLRFNFPYMEKKSSRPDPSPVAERTIQSVIEKAGELYPGLPVVASGKSFGGRMTSHLLCKHTIDNVRAIVFYGFPLHPPGNPGVERAAHLRDVRIPMLFLQGTKDQFARLDLLEKVCSELPLAQVILFENADHSFKVGKKDLIVDLAKKTDDWLKSLQIL
jgi:uncharacterized protein